MFENKYDYEKNRIYISEEIMPTKCKNCFACKEFKFVNPLYRHIQMVDSDEYYCDLLRKITGMIYYVEPRKKYKKCPLRCLPDQEKDRRAQHFINILKSFS